MVLLRILFPHPNSYGSLQLQLLMVMLMKEEMTVVRWEAKDCSVFTCKWCKGLEILGNDNQTGGRQRKILPSDPENVLMGPFFIALIWQHVIGHIVLLSEYHRHKAVRLSIYKQGLVLKTRTLPIRHNPLYVGNYMRRNLLGFELKRLIMIPWSQVSISSVW